MTNRIIHFAPIEVKLEMILIHFLKKKKHKTSKLDKYCISHAWSCLNVNNIFLGFHMKSLNSWAIFWDSLININ